MGEYPVAPHAGAWIETSTTQAVGVNTMVAPHAGAWIETAHKDSSRRVVGVAPHAGAWIETGDALHKRGLCAGRAPCGRVDRNVMGLGGRREARVAPHAGAWIETFRRAD